MRKMFLIKYLSFSCLLFSFLSSSSFAYMNIYPLVFDKRIDGMGAIQDFVLTNTTNKQVKYQVNLEKKNTVNDMTDWTEIYPKAITLNPGEKKEIKMYARSPKNTPIGEYTTILNIKELEVPVEKKKRKKVNVFTNLKVNLYGYVGKIDALISLKDVIIKREKGKLIMEGKIKNDSLRRLKLDMVLSDEKQKDEFVISELKLKKGEEIDLSNQKILQDRARLDYVYIYEKNQKEILKKVKVMGS